MARRARAARAVTALLHDRAGALRRGDRSGWLAGVDHSSGALRAREERLFDELRALPLQRWSWTVRDVTAKQLPSQRKPSGRAEAWSVQVRLRYRLVGFDAADVVRTRSLTVVRRGSAWRITAAGDGPVTGQHDPWELGPVEVVRGRAALVVGAAPRAVLRTYASTADRAVARVRAVWGDDWARRVVVVVPRDARDMARLLGGDGAGLEQTAAVTNGHLAGGGAVLDRVVVNPGPFGQLGTLGRQVVLTHEVTHVATRTSTPSALPRWLSEGFADYVAYRDSGVPVAVAAPDVLGEVRRGHVPERFPQSGDFDPAVLAPGQVSSAYEGAWLACRLIARRYGEPTLLRFYRAAGARKAAALEEAFRDVLDTTGERFLADWRSYLGEQAS